ncbi:tRNA epoxyqueuosine(34) reductase QueG [Segnochrobactraceae bacterium EtOH-i3]
MIRTRALALGFDEVRITRPDAIPAAPERLATFLADGHHAGLDWMESRTAERSDPRVLWPEVRSILMLAMSYTPDTDPRLEAPPPGTGRISVYARGRDYHDILKGKLKQLAGVLVAAGGGDVKVFVDTAPVMEKPLAAAAGLGWQGRHTNLVSRRLGNWTFLGAIFSTLELPADPPERDHCGSCRACLDACPTDAFPAPYRLDARRCVSYLTIEHKGPIPADLRPGIGDRIYGCDDCLAACPWNKFAQAGREAKLAARADLAAPDLAVLATLEDAEFRTFFSGSPIKRIGRDRFLRNVLIAIGNSGRPDLAAAARPHLADPAPIVRGAAIWALGRLLPGAEIATLRALFGATEPDPDVAAEWAALRPSPTDAVTSAGTLPPAPESPA